MLTTAADAIAMSQVTSSAKPIILVSAVALIDRDGRVLLAQRPAGRSMAGLWEFPGGKVESEETPEAALIRELDEELGIDTAESCLAPLTFASHGYDDFHLLMMVFVLLCGDGDGCCCCGDNDAGGGGAYGGDDYDQDAGWL